MNATKNLRDPNKKIRVEFERAPLKVRLKEKYLSLFFAKKLVWYLFRLVLLIGVCFVVIYPFITKIAASFMEFQDFTLSYVRVIPAHFTFDTYLAIFDELDYITALANTTILAVGCALIQTFICCAVGYGLAKFKFKGAKWVFLAVILTMIIPHATLQLSMATFFSDLDLAGPINTMLGGKGLIATLFGEPLDLYNSYFPFMILSVTALGFKNGLYIFLFRQFFRGVPDELEESAYIDGSGIMKTFIRVILPLSVPMLITVFLFAFSWQWTDTFYTDLFLSPSQGMTMLTDLIEETPRSLALEMQNFGAVTSIISSAIRGTCGIMIIMPLVIVYVFCQKFLVQGIERSGLTAD